MDYAYSDKLKDEEWASDIDDAIRSGHHTRADFGPHRCTECEAAAAMVAVGENPASPNGEYAMRPHFRIPHDSQCVISGQEKLIRKGVVMPAKTQLPGTTSFPAKLIRNNQREVVGDTTGDAPERNHTQGTHAPARARGAGPRPSEVATILPICSHFISYTKRGFADRQLELPGRTPTEPAHLEPYERAFQHLSRAQYTDPVPNRIVYADMMFALDPDITNDYIAIPVYAGPTNAELKRPTKPHRLRINWSSWSQRRRDSTRNRIEQHRDDAKRFYRDKTESMLVFAYAQPHLVGTTDFIVNTPADYCIIAARRGWWRREPTIRPRSAAGRGRR